MMVELSAIWVVVIVLIGVAIGIYSVCKGCQGMREQAGATQQLQQNRMTPSPTEAPELRSDQINQSQLYLISGATVYDKNPPSYEELIEPPPSYEETIKLQMEQQQQKQQQQQQPPPSLCEGSAHINLACDISEESSGTSRDFSCSAASTSFSHQHLPSTASSSFQHLPSTTTTTTTPPSVATEKPPHVGVAIDES